VLTDRPFCVTRITHSGANLSVKPSARRASSWCAAAASTPRSRSRPRCGSSRRSWRTARRPRPRAR